MTLARAMKEVATEFEAVAVAAASGDAEALESLYERYSDDIYRWVYVRVRKHTHAEDVTADVWLKVCRSIRTYQSTGHGFPAWLFTIAGNTLRDSYRGSGREHLTPSMLGIEQVSDAQGPEDAALAAELRSAVASAIAALPKRHAECVNLRFFHRLSVAETASVMETTEGNVRIIQHRAVRKLAKALPDPKTRVSAVGMTQKGASSVRSQTDSSHGRGSN